MISVVVCAHNEEHSIGETLQSLNKALLGVPHEILVVADRCTDRTVEMALKHHPKLVLEKSWSKWRNSYPESLQYGFTQARGDVLAIVDADVIVPLDFFKTALSYLRGNVASVSPLVVTAPNCLWNKVMHVWERTHNIGFLRGNYGQRVLTVDALKKVGGFRDVFSPDTDLDKRLSKVGYASILAVNLKVWHVRKPTLKRVIDTQVLRGRARKQLGFGFMHTLAHSVIRGKPFTVIGWLLQKLNPK